MTALFRKDSSPKKPYIGNIYHKKYLKSKERGTKDVVAGFIPENQLRLSSLVVSAIIREFIQSLVLLGTFLYDFHFKIYNIYLKREEIEGMWRGEGKRQGARKREEREPWKTFFLIT